MTNLKKRERAKTNASLISMVQRFSDITIMFAGLWLVCEVSGLSFLYMHLLVALITLVVFQMLGGITDFYRSWRGVRAATEFALLLQNWTLSVIFSAGLVAFNNDFDTQLKIWLAWYGLTSIGLVVCRSCIRIGAGWLRNHGYNKRMVAVAGDLAAGQMLMESFRNQPWLGFEVVGVYHDPKPGGVSNDWAGNLQQLVEDAKAGKIHNVYIAMQTCGRHCAGDAYPAADLPGAVLHCAGGKSQFTRAGYFPPDSLRHGWQADQSVEVPFHESDGERQSRDSGDAERSARHQSGELSAPHLAG